MHDGVLVCLDEPGLMEPDERQVQADPSRHRGLHARRGGLVQAAGAADQAHEDHDASSDKEAEHLIRRTLAEVALCEGCHADARAPKV